MKKQSVMIRLIAAVACVVILISIAATTVYAAKEMFREVTSAGVTGIDEPIAGKKGDYTAEVVNTGIYTVENIDFYETATNKLLAGTDTFKYDTEYYVLVTIKTKSAYYFATSQFTGYPTAAVSCNGNAAMVVEVGEDNAHTIGIKYFFPKTEINPNPEPAVPGNIINSIGIVGLTEPKTGETPSYLFGGYSHSSYTRDPDWNDEFYTNGLCWSFADGRSLERSSGEKFLPDEEYQVTIRIVPKAGYKFAVNANGDTTVTATINGKTADIIANETSAKLTYTFKKTEKAAITEASVTDLDAPAAGQKPDYTASYGSSSYSAADENNASTKNGISWYNETDRKPLATSGTFEAGKVYTVQVMIWTNDGNIFRYSGGTYGVSGTVNGKKADIMGRGEEEIILCYTFPEIEEPKHEHSPVKADEIKATCTEDGKKAHYFCPECGKFFEDAKCSKEITKINAWGIIPATGHSGGKATCAEKAKCKTCGTAYGDFAEHNYGTAWDYKDASGHAHTCKVCGSHDTVKAHTGGTADCEKKAKCSECKAEYGEAAAHSWSTGWDYTDAKGHAHKCTVCGEHDTVQAHAGGTADCQNKAKCVSCNMEYGKTGEHKYGTAWEYTSAAGHAHLCSVCGDHDSVVKHTPGPEATEKSEQTCTGCQYVIEPAKQHTHKMIRMDAVDATCITAGKKQYYYCSSCSLISSDSKGAKEISDPDTLIIPAEGHKDSKWKSDADVHWKECTVKGCNSVTVEKEAHEPNKSGKCTVCGYKVSNKTDTAQTTETETETKDKETTGLNDNTDIPNSSDNPGSVTSPDQGTAEGMDPETIPDEGDTAQSAPWILVISVAAALVVCVIIVTVVIVKRNKNNDEKAR